MGLIFKSNKNELLSAALIDLAANKKNKRFLLDRKKNWQLAEVIDLMLKVSGGPVDVYGDVSMVSGLLGIFEKHNLKNIRVLLDTAGRNDMNISFIKSISGIDVKTIPSELKTIQINHFVNVNSCIAYRVDNKKGMVLANFNEPAESLARLRNIFEKMWNSEVGESHSN